jgi:hypothetical protein
MHPFGHLLWAEKCPDIRRAPGSDPNYDIGHGCWKQHWLLGGRHLSSMSSEARVLHRVISVQITPPSSQKKNPRKIHNNPNHLISTCKKPVRRYFRSSRIPAPVSRPFAVLLPKLPSQKLCNPPSLPPNTNSPKSLGETSKTSSTLT